jgi:hypothetical protein
MRSTKLFTVSVAASLLLGAVAHASDAPSLPWSVGSFQQVPVAGSRNYPELHWTAVIGTGRAALRDTGVGTFPPAPLASAQSDPEPDRTAMIGTGTAASLER